MKLALEIDGKQVNHVVIKSLEGSIDFCKDFEATEETAQLVTSLKRVLKLYKDCLLYTSPSPRDQRGSRMPSSA